MNTKKRKVKNEAEKPPSKRAKVEENKQEKENTALKTEIEVKYFVGKEEIKKTLQRIDGKLNQVRTVMRRKIFDVDPAFIPLGVQKWLRLRDEGKGKTTLTLKQLTDQKSITGVKEIEIVISDFESCAALLESVGLKPRAYQENARETWELGQCIVCIDEWPGLPDFIEIEGPNKESVYWCAKEMGLEGKEELFGSIDNLYEKVLGVPSSTLIKIPKLTFENADEVLAPYIKKDL